jgi:hypothetical protein
MKDKTVIEVWGNDMEITCVYPDDLNKNFLIQDQTLLYIIEGKDWNDCIQQHYDKQGWGLYKPFE